VLIDKDDLLLRSVLFVPAHVDKFIDKAIKSDADILMFDLEDGVPEDKKELARDSLKNKLIDRQIDLPVFVRVNARETGLLEKDLESLGLPQVKGFLFPKVKDAADILFFEQILEKIEQKQSLPKGHFKILALLETAEGVLNALEIAKASPRMLALVFGHEDFLLDMQAEHAQTTANLLVPRMMVVMAARAAGCLPIDTPYLDIKNVEGCAERVSESRELGFSGMLVLHPLQIEVANNGYAPSEVEIEKARNIVALCEDAKKNNRSIAFANGKFVAPPILKQAKLVLAFVEKNRERL